MPGNFLLDGKHCHSIMLDAGYFYIPVNVVKLCFGMKFIYLETT